MSIPTIPRLILFTLAVLAGATAILTDRFFVLGILLVGFSSTILMNKGEQSKHWATPLTKWQILRGFLPMIVILSFLAYLIVTYEPNSLKSKAPVSSMSDVFKFVFVVATVFMIGQPWLRWYRSRDISKAPNPIDKC